MHKAAIIHRSNTHWEQASWQESLAALIDDPIELAQRLDLNPDQLGFDEAAAHKWKLRVPREFVARMKPGDANDPLLRQVLPSREELVHTPGYLADPLEEAQASPAAGIVHKYHGRLLLIMTGSCAIHCRYCFRREFDYKAHQRSRQEWDEALAYIADHPDVEEVILSGGDPLMLQDTVLEDLISKLNGISHLRRLRLHSRLPVVIPSRLDDALINTLAGFKGSTSLVIHSNHPNEIDASVHARLVHARNQGLMMMNQTVLMAGINDSASVLATLSRSLFDAGVMPYYLHLLDKVAGSAHFDVSEETALTLRRRLMEELPGYLVPKLVRELAGLAHKQAL